mmetsp:Transcript_87417/g.138034  ORF Transcript_87417/g.138034 Transcript_87417/m.138034 type:complete len:224 (-) Transcript_87417:504-1175(-)
MPRSVTIDLSLSAMIGKFSVSSSWQPHRAKTSLLHSRWESTSSQERPINLQPSVATVAASLWQAPSSVVQTGVKSLGCEKNIVHGLSGVPFNQSCNLKSPAVVFTLKFGIVAPIFRGLAPVGGEAFSTTMSVLAMSSRGGHFTDRRYGLPDGSFSICRSLNFACASSVFTPGPTITRSPYSQSTGVAKPLLCVSCSEVSTRKTSSKLRPVVAGYKIVSFTVTP